MKSCLVTSEEVMSADVSGETPDTTAETAVLPTDLKRSTV
jgi:hypothetical protein